MAAGMGSRYGGLKQLDSFGPSGERVIDYSLFDALRAGFQRFVFIIRKDIEEPFREKIGSIVEPRAEVRYVFQEIDKLPAGFSVPQGRTKPWGTGHAVLCARPSIDAPFGVINADDFYGKISFEQLYGFLKQAPCSIDPLRGCMVGFILENTLSENGHVSRGVCTLTPDGTLARVEERTRIQRVEGTISYSDNGEQWHELGATSTVSMNMWGFTPGFMEALAQRFIPFLKQQGGEMKSEYFLPSVADRLIAEGQMRVDVLQTPDKWFGVTYEQDKEGVSAAIHRLVASGAYPSNLWQ
jgi:dTDP-glucose pyrophosphorylase